MGERVIIYSREPVSKFGVDLFPASEVAHHLLLSLQQLLVQLESSREQQHQAMCFMIVGEIVREAEHLMYAYTFQVSTLPCIQIMHTCMYTSEIKSD